MPALFLASLLLVAAAMLSPLLFRIIGGGARR